MITASNGKIFWPNGKPLIAAGLNLYNGKPTGQVLGLFPKANWFRCATPDLTIDPLAWDDFVAQATKRGAVCEFEFHPWPMLQEGQVDRNAYGAWITKVVQRFGSNPLFVMSSMNEPQSGGETDEDLFVYQTARGAGYQGLILFMGGTGGGNPGQTGKAVLDASKYPALKNVAFTLHCYGWPNDYTTNQNTVNATLLGNPNDSGIQSLKAISSADGPMAVLIDEFGPCTSGNAPDPNAQQVIQAVTVWAVENGYSSGYAAWDWDADPVNAVQQGGKLTGWGTQLNAAIARTLAWAVAQGSDANGLGGGGTPTPTPTPTPSPTPTPTPTPTGTAVVLTPTSGGSFRDSTGAEWSLGANGAVMRDGKAVLGGGGTAQLVSFQGHEYGQDAKKQDWYLFDGTNWNKLASAPNFTPTPTPTPKPTPTPTPQPTPQPTPPPSNAKAGVLAELDAVTANLQKALAAVQQARSIVAGL